VRQLEKRLHCSNSAAHRQIIRLHLNFTRWYSVAPWKLQNCQNPLRIESKMADAASNVLIHTYLSRVFDTPCKSTRHIKFGLCLVSSLRTLNCSECLKDYVIFSCTGWSPNCLSQIRAGFAAFLLLLIRKGRRSVSTVRVYQIHSIHGDQA